MKSVLYFGLLICLLIGAAILYELSLAPDRVTPEVVVVEPVAENEMPYEENQAGSVDGDGVKEVATTTPDFAILDVPYEQAGVTILLNTLIEDSRCPSDVACIQAGTVRVRGILTTGTGEMSERTFVLGEPVYFAGRQITLTEVLPRPVSTRTAPMSEYKFSFTIE